MPPNRLTTRQAIRRFRLGSGPLKRRSDRLEYLARILLIVVLLSAVPVALAVATASSAHGQAEVLAQAAERHQVDARLLEDASPLNDGSESISQLGQANAVWTGPSGAEHTGVIAVSDRARAGSLHPIWIDHQGNRTARPLSNGDVASRSVGIALVIYLGTAHVAWGAYRCVRLVLDRSRSRRWATEWAVVEPEWTGKVP
jgi:hypothetical protein